MANEYAHMCRDGHHEIGFNDPEDKYGELCPMCAAKNLVLELQDALRCMGATLESDGALSIDMKRYHAAHRCEKHRAHSWREQEIANECVLCVVEKAGSK